MQLNFKALKIVQSFLLLKGNTRVSVMFEPFFGISYTFYNFYFSLYLKEMGVTDEQIGGIIAAGFISGAFFSLFGGIITDYLGRKKTTLIFDFLAWPFAIFVYFISRSFPMFILATVINNLVKIVTVAWNLMVVEDADSDQRKAAFNLLNIINISMGIITPLAGLFVAGLGIIRSERIFMVFAMLSMTTMIVFRNRGYTETKAGLQILAEHKGLKLKEVMKKGLYGGAVSQIFRNRRLRIVILIQILFNLSLPLGAFNSMYFAPFMTEQIGINKASVSFLGTVYAGVMLFVFLIINPVVSKKHVSSCILTGLVLQGAALFGITMVPAGGMIFAVLSVGLYAIGYGTFLPFFNALFADVSDSRERAGIYSFVQTATSILSAVIGAVSGFIYAAQPRLIFFITVLFLLLCACTMIVYINYENKHKDITQSPPTGDIEF
jgi:MFS family permease